MKIKILIAVVVAMAFLGDSASANQFADQYERKLQLRNEQLGIETEKRFISSMAAVNIDGFIKPTEGTFTSGFGWRDIGDGQEFHKGVDIANETGTDIKSAAAGQVTFAGVMSGYGNVIIINHTIKEKVHATVYAHLSIMSVIVGQSVKQGQSIAKMGSTGRSTGPHLHFEIHDGVWNGGRTNAIDPAPFIGL